MQSGCSGDIQQGQNATAGVDLICRLLGASGSGDGSKRGCGGLSSVTAQCNLQGLCDGTAFKEDQGVADALGNLRQQLRRSLFLCRKECFSISLSFPSRLIRQTQADRLLKRAPEPKQLKLGRIPMRVRGLNAPWLCS